MSLIKIVSTKMFDLRDLTKNNNLNETYYTFNCYVCIFLKQLRKRNKNIKQIVINSQTILYVD